MNNSFGLLAVFVALLLFSSVSCDVSTYVYNDGGSDWTGTCATGSLQSPIDLSNVKGTCDNSVTIDFVLHNYDVTTSVVLGQSGFYSEGEFSALYAKDINGVLIGYTGTKIQIHTPSEHSVEDSGYDLEIQFYHTIKSEFSTALGDSALSTAVVSLFFNVATTSTTTFFDTWLPSATASFALNPATSFPDFMTSAQYYTYQGSLTQPSCDETVNWYVFSGAFSITSLQLTSIRKYLQGDLTFANGHGNNRNRQSVNSRTILMGNITCEEQFIYFFSFLILYIFINYFIFKLL